MNSPLLPPGWRIGFSAGLLFVLLAWERAQPFFALWGRPVDRARHGALNLRLGAFDASLFALVFAGAWLAVTQRSAVYRFGMPNPLTKIQPSQKTR